MAYWLLLVLPLDREKKKSKTRDIIREAQRGDFVPHVLLAGISSAVALTVPSWVCRRGAASPIPMV